jgi:D-lactate dehydrogenase (cytochrome)
MTTTGPAPHPEVADAVAKLAAVLGDAHVLTGEADRRWYAADFTDAEVPTPVAVAQPSCTEDVVEVVKIARGAGLAVVPRGGGMSYTLAHTPARAETLVVDLRRMDRIVECNLADRYVTVEAGVTWAQLMERLRGTGSWLTFNGTLSGLHATVGGTLAQNSAGLGRGWLSEAVLGLEVVLGDGRVLQTGSGAAEGTAPYYRNFGPDLSGLFLCDSGAFGFKTRATLRLDPVPGGTAFGCYAFDDARPMIAAELEMARTGLISECIGADSFMNTVMAETPPPPRAEMVAVAKAYLAQSSSKVRALRTLARTARPGGMKFLAGVKFSLALVTDAADQAAADRNLARLRRIALHHGGRSLPPTLPLGLRYAPYQPIHPLMVGKHGEAGFPSNALFPLSKAQDAVAALDEFMADNAGVMRAHGIYEVRNYLICGHGFGIEPIIFWPDRLSAYRSTWASEEQRRAFAAAPDNAPARAAALDLRARMIAMFRGIGAAHLQLGKVYPYREAYEGTVAWDVLTALKDQLDPDHVVNPGVLGLD